MAWSDIPGWFSWQDVYDEMVDSAVDGDSIVEIGVAFGRSIAYLARRAIDSRKRLNIYAIDPWHDGFYHGDHAWPSWGGEHAKWVAEQGGPFAAFLKCMQHHAPKELEYVNILRGYSHQFVPAFKLSSLRGVLIDGDHRYEPVLKDIRDWQPRVMSGGILAGDDHSPEQYPGVVQACKEAFGDKYEVRRDWIWVKKL